MEQARLHLSALIVETPHVEAAPHEAPAVLRARMVHLRARRRVWLGTTGESTDFLSRVAELLKVESLMWGEELELGDGVDFVATGGLTASDVRLNCAGTTDAGLGKSAQAAFTLLAPDALIQRGEGDVYSGHILAKRVRIGKGVRIQMED